MQTLPSSQAHTLTFNILVLQVAKLCANSMLHQLHKHLHALNQVLRVDETMFPADWLLFAATALSQDSWCVERQNVRASN
jgi:hypothetical protein